MISQNILAMALIGIFCCFYGIRLHLTHSGNKIRKILFIPIFVSGLVYFGLSLITTGVDHEIIVWSGLFIAMWTPIGIIAASVGYLFAKTVLK